MSLADHLVPTEQVCRVGEILLGLSTEDHAVLGDALADPQFSAARISRALRAEGHEVGMTTVKLHRNGGCRCVAR